MQQILRTLVLSVYYASRQFFLFFCHRSASSIIHKLSLTTIHAIFAAPSLDGTKFNFDGIGSLISICPFSPRIATTALHDVQV